jgi:prolyl 4-hydroxylase
VPANVLSDYVKVYDGTLAPERCQQLIDRFEASAHLHQRKEAEGSYSFSQLSVSHHWPDIEAEVGHILMTGFGQYRQALQIGPYWPATPLSEEIRLKRYLPDGRDSFPPHVDVMDQSTTSRFIAAILYLNGPIGGETIFSNLGLRIAPLPGRLLIFPPLWLFPHAGLAPRRGAKYILHSYLWYPLQDALRYPV